jgi:arylsulfatase A-like enzyme
MPRIPVILAALLVFALAAGVGGWFLLRPPEPPRHPDQPPPTDPNPPGGQPPAPTSHQAKLVVLVVFDQMRGDYMSRWAELYGPDGFERIKKQGIWFSECHVPYACTSTGPGHASLSTGVSPSVHGIVENEWYDREHAALIYCCQPNRPYELLPPLPADVEKKKPTRGSDIGFSPERLLAQTVGDSLKEATKGKGRVFSLSIKDRTAVLMGGQKPDGVYCFDTRDGKFHTGAFYGRDAAHPWVTEFNNAKVPDSWFNTVWTRLLPDEAKYLKFAGVDDAPGEALGFNGQGRTFPHSLRGKLTAPAKKYYEALEGSPFGNEMLFRLAKSAITAERLGKGEVPDLLCVSFSSNDLLGHRWGPDSQEVLDVTLRSDKLVGELLTFLDTEVGKDQYTLVITADHGVCPIPELQSTRDKYPSAKRVMTKDLAADLESALAAAYGGEKTRWLEAFDADTWPWVYLNYKTIETRKLKVEDVAAFVRDWFAGRGFLETAFTRHELDDKNAPDRPFRTAVLLAYRPDRCGDVIAIPKAGVLVTPYEGGTAHGSPQPYDAYIPFLVYGAGVPALGQIKEKVSSLSIAPTLARALGVPAPNPKSAILPPKELPAGERRGVSPPRRSPFTGAQTQRPRRGTRCRRWSSRCCGRWRRTGAGTARCAPAR